jgi:DNA-binding NarL/FixJ family response regulator
MIRILLVDDQDLVRAGLRGILRQSFGFVIAGECADGSEALAAVEQTNPDIVLMDVRMPRLDGVAATSLLRAERPNLPVLALTTFDDDEALAGMLRAGAAGFVLKGVPADELHRAVRTVAAGDDQLTERELDVLTLIGQGRTNSEIAELLFIGEGTVKTHINHVFAKLGLRDRSAAIIFAYDHHLVPNEQ